MIKPTLIFTNSKLEELQQRAATAPRRIRLAARRELLASAEKLAEHVYQQPPGPVVYPFKFATDKSRIAYFASNGFGHGIPYIRTGALGSAWQINAIIVGNDVVVLASNDAKGAPFVFGPRQVPGHRRTGWPNDVEARAAIGTGLVVESVRIINAVL